MAVYMALFSHKSVNKSLARVGQSRRGAGAGQEQQHYRRRTGADCRAGTGQEGSAESGVGHLRGRTFACSLVRKDTLTGFFCPRRNKFRRGL